MECRLTVFVWKPVKGQTMRNSAVVSVLVVMALAAALQGADCLRFRGPAGDGVFPETGLLKKWPDGGPKVA